MGKYKQTKTTNQYKINLHLLEPCNYRCRHCFAHFGSRDMLPTSSWVKIIDSCMDVIQPYAFNLAGGEPLLYPGLREVAAYIRSTGAQCTLISNGSLMSDEWIRENAEMYSMIGLSVDSFLPEILLKMGRSDTHGVLTSGRIGEICRKIKEANLGCTVKINTVVTALNKEENLAHTLETFPVDKWKVMKWIIPATGSGLL